MFVTQGIGRHELQFEPDRTLWNTIEIVQGTHVHLARTVYGGSRTTRLILLCSSEALFRAVAGQVFGEVEELWSLGRLCSGDQGQLCAKRIASVRQDSWDILGGVSGLEVFLESGERYSVNPVQFATVQQAPTTIWQAPWSI